MQSKKQLILWTLNILNLESDENHPITQTRMAKIISEVYPCDRKTVCRNIRFLREMGYPIKKTGKGFYMERRLFSLDEIKFVEAAIDAAENNFGVDKEDVKGRVVDILTKAFRR